MLDLFVTGGLVVAPHGVGHWNIGIRDGKIVLMANPLEGPFESTRTYDATGKIVIPGGIEAHTHCSTLMPTTVNIAEGEAPQQGIFSGGPEPVSRAALFGGTTTLLDFAPWEPGIDLFATVEKRRREFEGQSHVDFNFHCALFSTRGDLPFEILDQIPELIESGVPSFKVWTSNVTPTRPRQMTDLGHTFAIAERIASANGILAVHGEDEEIVMFDYKRLAHEGRTATKYLSAAHSAVSEDLAFRRITRMAEWTKTAIYFMHVSAAEGVEAIREARARGLPVYGETLQTYLCFTDEQYAGSEGPLYHTHPSLKSARDQDAMWAGLSDRTLSTIATDESLNAKDTKLLGKTIYNTTGGASTIETRIGIAYGEGVVKRKMSLKRLVEVTSENPARLFGLYPRKGCLAVGSDADIAVIDPSERRTLTAQGLHGSDYTVWEGREIEGWPSATIIGGRLAVDGGRLLEEVPRGQWVPGRLEREVVEGPTC